MTQYRVTVIATVEAASGKEAEDKLINLALSTTDVDVAIYDIEMVEEDELYEQ